MAKFKYKLQNILELKMKLEEQQKMALVTARINLNDEEDKLEALYARKRGYEEALREAYKNKLNVNAIKMGALAYESMDYFIRKIQEKLREKAFSNFLKEVDAEEAAMVDELVAYKYGTDTNKEEWKIDG